MSVAKPSVTRMTRWRIGLGAVGIALGLFGVFRLLTQIGRPQLTALAEWMVGVVILHDLVLSPLIVGVGCLLAFLPARGRRFVQGAMIAGGLITALGLVFVVYVDTHLLEHKIGGSGPVLREPPKERAAKSLLTQDFGAHLVILLAVVVATCAVLYLGRVLLDRRRRVPADTSTGGSMEE